MVGENRQWQMCSTFLSRCWLESFWRCWQPCCLLRVSRGSRIKVAMASASSASASGAAPASPQGPEPQPAMHWCSMRNAMHCPSCTTWKLKASWSPAQWRGWSPYHVQTCRNCCSDCSPNYIDGSEHAPPAAAKPAHGPPAHGSSQFSEHASQAAADPQGAWCTRPSASIVMPSRQESQTIFDNTITMLRNLTPPTSSTLTHG